MLAYDNHHNLNSFPTRRSSDLCHLQGQVFVGRGARVGKESWLMPGAVVAAECEVGCRVRLQPGVIVGDRKSTRLNSSHLGISYAVFCLKKKNKERDNHKRYVTL